MNELQPPIMDPMLPLEHNSIRMNRLAMGG